MRRQLLPSNVQLEPQAHRRTHPIRPQDAPHRHAGNVRPARNPGARRRDKGMPAAHPPAETLLLKRENRPPSYSENKIREEAEQSGNPAAAVDLRSGENVKLDRVRLRDDAPADAGARPGKPGGRAPPATRWGASRCNPQGAGTPGPGSRPQPTAAAARTRRGKKRNAPRPARLRKQAPQEQTMPRPPERGRET